MKFLNFNKIYNQALDHYSGLTQEKQKQVKEDLDHGKALLDNNDQLKAYIALYGDIHRKKMIRAYSHLPNSILRSNFSVVDWGCGQGLASILLQEYIENTGNSNIRMSDIVLVEPSKPCLSMAEHYIQWTVPDISIWSINKKEECVDISDFPLCDLPTIHLLSNIVDIPEFRGDNVVKYLTHNRNYRQIVVCVSPFYAKDGRGKRMYDFGNRLHHHKRIYCFERHADEWKENYSCQIHIYDNLPY